MEEQDTILREALAREVLPDTIREIMAEYKIQAFLEINRERNRDGDVREMTERVLSLYNEACSRVNIPPECILCPRDEEVARYPPKTHHGYMELPCGHKVHTQCYLNMMMRYDIHTVASTRCYICDDTVMESQAITFFRNIEEDDRRASVVDLWTTNPDFRKDLKALIKERAACIKLSNVYGKEARDIINEFKQVVNIPVQTVRLYRQTYTARIAAITSRRRMIYYNNKYIKNLNDFCRKYKTWTSRFRPLRGMEGVPRLPTSMNLPWKYRSSAARLLRVASGMRMF
jgi:hypothetical protein